jgi:ADP-ribose pyrophosphatase YjhB (NUDIX family)
VDPPSRHLSELRERVPDLPLFAPRIALVAGSGDRVLVDDRGELPATDLEIEEPIAGAAHRLLRRHRLADTTHLGLLDVRTGPAWLEEHPDLGPLQPIWILLSADSVGQTAPDGGARPSDELPLLSPVEATEAGGPPPPKAADYIRRIRSRVGRDRIFYPWAGLALRDGSGRIFLVRLAQNGQWHCPGGGMEIGERPAETAARELAEETGLICAGDRLLGCFSRHLRSFENGDRIHGIAILLEGTIVGGRQRDDETGEIDAAGWFDSSGLPPLEPPWDARVRLVLKGDGARFD